MSSRASLLPGVPLIESPLFPTLIDSAAFDQETLQTARDLHSKGYAIIRFPDPDFDAVADRIKKALAPQFDLDAWRRDGWRQNAGIRVQDAWTTNADVRRLAVNGRVLQILSLMYGRRAFPFQTLNFPVGTQQHFHTDAVHFSSVPERFVCGVWVALEDIHEDSGPLVYYPGSHRLPILMNEHLGVTALGNTGPYDHYARFEEVWQGLVAALGLQRETFCPRKGQGLIWASNLLHGGDRQRDPARTRWSQVTHYFFEDCAYYTPLLSDPFCGSIFFRDGLIDITTGQRVANRYAGRDIPDDFIRYARPAHARDRALPPGFDPALYLAANPDVKAAGVDPIVHYLHFGSREGRKLRP